ncbi:hypothetical protein LSH36_576g00049 [Paralvinella palmiformis]|uniref:t-SNARE coiled-coil homology domain-containing protein n=1 Tax=Paralvinella palmiformis TaxID=53620 RepID=A0AAD9J5R1_9ANNE|nr:hypothetical protein LSH36_576g00049 [Paralvinella palmiformis]
MVPWLEYCPTQFQYQTTQQWDLLTKEQINSSRTVKQLKSTIKQLEQTREQILAKEQAKFDDSIGDIQQQTIAAIIEFLDLQAGCDLDPLLGPCDRQSLINEGMNKIVARKVRQHSLELSAEHAEGVDSSPGVSINEKQLIIDKPVSAQAQQAWQDLKMSLVELNSLIQEFSTVVHSQQETVDQIEDNIIYAQANVTQGITHLGAAAKLKSAMFPVAGALLGGAIGGPVGLVAGVKLGGLAAITGGLAGFTGGHILKIHRNKSTETELQKLSSRSSQNLGNVVGVSKSDDLTASPSARSSYSNPGF